MQSVSPAPLRLEIIDAYDGESGWFTIRFAGLAVVNREAKTTIESWRSTVAEHFPARPMPENKNTNIHDSKRIEQHMEGRIVRVEAAYPVMF